MKFAPRILADQGFDTLRTRRLLRFCGGPRAMTRFAAAISIVHRTSARVLATPVPARPAEVAPSKEELRSRLAAKVEALRHQRHAEERAARNAAAYEFHVRRALASKLCPMADIQRQGC